MSNHDTEPRKYLAVMLVGAVAGGIVVAVVTRAIPRIMSQMMKQMMSEMPQRMMAQMRAEGIDPAEMCQCMMANFKAAQSSEDSTAQSQN